jgi:hypothetical protein
MSTLIIQTNLMARSTSAAPVAAVSGVPSVAGTGQTPAPDFASIVAAQRKVPLEQAAQNDKSAPREDASDTASDGQQDPGVPENKKNLQIPDLSADAQNPVESKANGHPAPTQEEVSKSAEMTASRQLQSGAEQFFGLNTTGVDAQEARLAPDVVGSPLPRAENATTHQGPPDKVATIPQQVTAGQSEWTEMSPRLALAARSSQEMHTANIPTSEKHQISPSTLNQSGNPKDGSETGGTTWSRSETRIVGTGSRSDSALGRTSSPSTRLQQTQTEQSAQSVKASTANMNTDVQLREAVSSPTATTQSIGTGMTTSPDPVSGDQTPTPQQFKQISPSEARAPLGQNTVTNAEGSAAKVQPSSTLKTNNAAQADHQASHRQLSSAPELVTQGVAASRQAAAPSTLNDAAQQPRQQTKRSLQAPLHSVEHAVTASAAAAADVSYRSGPAPYVSAFNAQFQKLTTASSFISPLEQAGDKAVQSLAASDGVDVMQWDPVRQLQTAPGTHQPMRGDLAPHVARQLVEVMAQAANRPTEIALSPQELGRVRMSVATDERGITVSILAERPETLDLMRRNIDQLGETFRDMGYETITFAFSQSNGGSGDSRDEPGQGNATSDKINSDEPETATAAITLDHAATGGVDIRL